MAKGERHPASKTQQPHPARYLPPRQEDGRTALVTKDPWTSRAGPGQFLHLPTSLWFTLAQNMG